MQLLSRQQKVFVVNYEKKYCSSDSFERKKFFWRREQNESEKKTTCSFFSFMFYVFFWSILLIISFISVLYFLSFFGLFWIKFLNNYKTNLIFLLPLPLHLSLFASSNKRRRKKLFPTINFFTILSTFFCYFFNVSSWKEGNYCSKNKKEITVEVEEKDGGR